MYMISQGRFDPRPLFLHVGVPFDAASFPLMYDTLSEYRDGVVKVLFTFDDD